MRSPQKHIRFDWAIKRLLRQKANFVILEGFLSELLKQEIRIQEILESQSNKATEYDKSNQVDILVKSSSDELMLIEVQNEREHDYFHRMNYGQAKLTTEHIYSGEAYGKIKKVISINIVYFELGQGDDYIYVGGTDFMGMHTHQKLDLSPIQINKYHLREVADVFTTYYLLKVNKFDDVATSTLDEWIYFLKNSDIPDSFHAKGLREAKEQLRVDNLAQDEREAYENYVKLERIRMSEITTAQDEVHFKLQPMIDEANQKAEEAERIAALEKQKTLEAEHRAESENLKALEAEHRAEQEKQKALEAEHRADEEKQKALEAQHKAFESEQTIVRLIKELYQLNLPLSQISATTDKTEEVIKKILAL